MGQEFKVGDRIRVTDGGCHPYYHDGDIGTLTKIDKDGDWWADFSGQGNLHVEDDGLWCVGDNTDRSSARFELI